MAFGLPVIVTFKDKEYEKLAEHLLGKSKYAGCDILICWHHGQALALAAALGVDPGALPASSAGPDHWPDDAFGWLLQISYDGDGRIVPARTVCLDENLTEDDPQHPPPDQGG